MLKWLNSLVWALVFWGVLEWAGFSLSQSILLALLLTLLIWMIGDAAPKVKYKFSPYYVTVDPKWHQILTDYKVINTDEDWTRLQEWMQSPGLPADHLARKRVVWFSIVRNDVSGALVWRGASEGFSCEVDWEWAFTNNGRWMLDKEYQRTQDFTDVALFMKQFGDVYRLGIRVPVEWWKEAKASCPAPIDEHTDHMCGRVDLTIASLPLAEFDVYWDRVEYDMKWVDKVWAKVDEGRKKHGWELAKKSEDYRRWEPTTIQHRYFDAYHHSL
jgi:hypothetical protein